MLRLRFVQSPKLSVTLNLGGAARFRPKKPAKITILKSAGCFIKIPAMPDITIILRYTILSIKMLQEIIHLFVPPWPVVIHVKTPVVDPCRDRFFSKKHIESPRVGNGFIFPGALTHADNDFTLTVTIQIPGVIDSGKIIQGRIEVYRRHVGGRKPELAPVQAIESA